MRLMTVVGARPEFVKAAPVSRALAAHPGDLDERLVHTGQHYDHEMSDIFFTDLGLTEPIHLGIGSGRHGAQTGEMLAKLEALFIDERPDAVMVYGDTNSTLAGALSAAKLHIPVVHVEAGLRSFNMAMPEEVNRRLTDHVSTVLLCPSAAPAAQLATEGIRAGVHVVGDVNLDAMRQNMPSASAQRAVLEAFGVESGGFGLVTVHRAENTDDPARLSGILEGLGRVAATGLPLVFPVHPRTRSLVEHALPEGVVAAKPVGFEAFISLAHHAAVGLTDSGGVQKELFWLETPCVTLRDETEWIETVEAGWNRIVGADPELIMEAFEKAATVTGTPPPVYGTGHAAEEIAAVLSDWSGA